MPQSQKLYSSEEAMAYLGLGWGGFRYHVYEQRNLPYQKVGPALVFTQKDLDEFKRKHQAVGYTMEEAARYLGVNLSWVRNHVFNTKKLVPDGKMGKKFIFTKETLDAVKFFIAPPQAAQPERERA